MGIIAELRRLDRPQRMAFLASLLGWTLDAFDYFLVVFLLRDIAADFRVKVAEVALALTLTLMCRPIGALLFGWLAERFGRRPVLMADVVAFSVLELAAAFSPNLTVFFCLRALFGVAMGGEWGVGSSLVMESIPARSRGVVSGILQEGYALGYLLAAIVYGVGYSALGWRGMFVIGVFPALLAVLIRRHVRESPAWRPGRKAPGTMRSALRRQRGLFLYVIVLMTAFNFFSHGTQDLYPTMLQAQKGLSPHLVGAITVVANIGAILGGLTLGHLSQRFGRRRAIVAASALALPIVPFWAFAATPAALGLGAFLMQFAVQGAWGIVPAHLNELSPPEVRATFPGFAYQLGNLAASANAVLQARLAAEERGNYALALAAVAAITAVVLMALAAAGPESKDAVLAEPAAAAPPG